MHKTLQYEKTSARTYRHFSVPPVAPAASAKKLEFFYIGKRAGVIDSLIRSFDSGYAAETPEQAKSMILNLASRSLKVPDVIIAESSLVRSSLAAFTKFLSSTKSLRSIPFFIEGSHLTNLQLQEFATAALADDIILLTDMNKERFVAKINFWNKVKEKVSNEPQPLGDTLPMENTVSELLKRAFDVIISALLIIMFLPVFVLIYIALKIESKGPVFYISKRAGKGYKIFNFYKFRTMEVEANNKITDVSHLNIYNPLQADGPVFVKINNDPRITRLGTLLRKCSLDELPQLLNVLKGDMSLVGNRPLPLYEASSLTTDQWAARFMAPAGMTGLWQIRRKNKYKMSAEERVKLDINYAEKSNFLFDLWIMANTPSAVIQGDNA